MSSFTTDIKQGLESTPKTISSKYLYDDNGSKIFQQIMHMPEYYLSRCEFDILKLQSFKIFKKLSFNTHFNIIELGCGDGYKIGAFLKKLLDIQANFHYIPIDISAKALEILIEKLNSKLPDLNISPTQGDYLVSTQNISQQKDPVLILFLGSNIGNYNSLEVNQLLQQFYSLMKKGDKILIGFDLVKTPKLIENAYNDPRGITKEFNLNLLTRINNELGGNFEIKNFDFDCYYKELTKTIMSSLKSLKNQQVTISKLNCTFSFQKDEKIMTEISAKYDLKDIEQLATQNQFKVIEHFIDSKNYFTDSLWEK